MDRKHILVVDDELNILATYKAILERNGYNVSTASTAMEARQILTEGKIDFLLCDLTLRDRGSGLDVLEFARKTYDVIPAILLTGYASEEDCDRAESLGVPLLYKPVEVECLLATIGDLVSDSGLSHVPHKH